MKKLLVLGLKQLDLGSAIAVRLTKLTGKSKVPIHPKHFLTQSPWFTKYLKAKDVVLDLGSGNGQNAIKAAKIAKRVVACEIDQNLIAQARTFARLKKTRNIKWQMADLEQKLKFRKTSFDKVLFLDVLEHLKNRDQILEEIRRVLIPNGLLFLGVPNSQTSWKKLQRSVDIWSYSDPDHKIEFSEKSIRDLLKKHNFGIIDFGYGKYDTPFRGLFDIVGGFSLTLYKKISDWRTKKVKTESDEASGFEIVARKK